MNRILIICSAAVLFSALTTTSAQSIHLQTVDPPLFPAGEELTYEARWWFIKLGTIRTYVANAQKGKNYNIIAYINSYSGIPFVNLHAVFHSTMDADCYSTSFESREQEDNGWEVIRYRYDRKKSILYIEDGIAPNDSTPDLSNTKTDTVKIESRIHDGLSLLFFARAQLFGRLPLDVPTMVHTSMGTTYLDLPGNETSVKIDAVNYPVDVVHFEGNAKFSGIFGFNGPFEGWFSNDGARIPIKAKTNVLIGSINIELIGWKRSGWEPPRSK